MKNRLSTSSYLLVSIIGPAIVLMALALLLPKAQTGQFGTALGTGSGSNQRTFNHKYGVWDYTATQTPADGLNVKINYGASSVSALDAYATANKELAQQLSKGGGTVEIRVTFRTFMEPSQFRTWAVARGLHVKDSTLGAYDTKGYGVSLGVSAQADETLPQVAIDREMESLARPTSGGAVSPPLTLRGVYETHGMIDTQLLAGITSDSSIFLADVTVDIVRRDLAAQGAANPAGATIVSDPPFGAMLRLGLENFR